MQACLIGNEVVRSFDWLSKKDWLRRHHFDGEYHWVWAWGIREHCKRVAR